MNPGKIKEDFDNVAEQYDKEREKFIPCYNDYYGMSVDFLSSIIKRPQEILDLGAGTGLLTRHFFEYFPDSNYTLTDISDEMLKVAKQRFSGRENFNFLTGDYTKELPDGKFDLICSALSIHHLEEGDKQNLYRQVYEKLNPEGSFINLDQFNPSSEFLNNRYNNYWYKQILKSDLPEEEYNKWLNRRESDKENTINETIGMLTASGFKDVECVYSYLKFGVVVGFKRKVKN